MSNSTGNIPEAPQFTPRRGLVYGAAMIVATTVLWGFAWGCCTYAMNMPRGQATPLLAVMSGLSAFAWCLGLALGVVGALTLFVAATELVPEAFEPPRRY